MKYGAVVSITPGTCQARRYSFRIDDDPRYARTKPKCTNDLMFDRVPEADEIEQFRLQPRIFQREAVEPLRFA